MDPMGDPGGHDIILKGHSLTVNFGGGIPCEVIETNKKSPAQKVFFGVLYDTYSLTRRILVD